MAKLDGFSAKSLFEGMGIGWDGFLVLDSFYSKIDKDDVDLTVNIGKGMTLKFPVWASPMDKVCESDMGIAIALQGGIGAIHNNNTIDQAVSEIIKVKRYENGFIEDPIAVSPEMGIDDLVNLTRMHGISSYPVTDDGTEHGRLLGLITKSDYSRRKHSNLYVKDRMVKDVIKLTLPFRSDDHLGEANDMLLESRNPILPIISTDGKLQYIVTRSDIEKNEDFPNATKDNNKQLRILFACDTKETDYDRIDKCFEAGADGVIVDTSQGFTRYSTAMLDYIHKRYPDKLLVGGNISTSMAAEKLAKHHIDAARIGQGPGSICTTQGVLGKGRAQANAVYSCSKALKKHRITSIADGGIKNTSDIYKALSIGADSVMLGNLLAGCDESPGQLSIDKMTGLPVKEYRGMGSEAVLSEKAGARGYSKQAQGVSGKVTYNGSVHRFIPLLKDTIVEALFLDNARTIVELQKKMYSGRLRFETLMPSAAMESKPHDLVRYE